MTQTLPSQPERFALSRVAGTLDSSKAPFYRVAEMWYPDVETLRAAFGSEQGQAVLADLENFVTGGATKLDFGDAQDVSPQHYAFAVSDKELDAILARITQAGLQFSADPRHQQPGELNDVNGGRGLYVRDPDGHSLEFLTVP